MNRRAILASAGTLTIGPVQAAIGKSNESDPECDTVEITTGTGGRGGTTDEVPEPWWEQVKRARDVQDELTDDYGAEPWFEGTGRSSGNETICGYSALIVEVHTSDRETARKHLDETRNGVRISVEEVTKADLDNLGGDVLHNPPSADSNDSGVSDGDSPENDSTADSETDSTSEPSDSTPGLGALGAIVSLGIARYLLVGRESGDDRF